MTAFTYATPTVGGSEDTWGTTLNANWNALGTFIGSLDSTELAVLDGITATTAELNLLDGATLAISAVTATAAELNLLDGVTATTAELNYVDGVTSPIQEQIDAKASTATQETATWEAGTGTTHSLVSPANVKAAILALASTYTQPTAAGAVGTYAFLWQNANTSKSAGSQVAGSTLRYSGVGADAPNTTSGNVSLWQSGTPAGSWRCMGAFGVNGSYEFSTLWLRYA